jgi:hypothetical protein
MMARVCARRALSLGSPQPSVDPDLGGSPLRVEYHTETKIITGAP